MIGRVLGLYLANREERFPRQKFAFRTDPASYASEPVTGLRITWFGHSGALLEMDGIRLLLDPVWDPRASPYSFAGPVRFFAPTLALRDLPALDAVLISHDHYDHLGERTVRELMASDCAREAQWLTSLEVGPILERFGVPRSRIVELNWMEQIAVHSQRTGASATLHAYPARHFSGRSLRSRFKTLWSSFVLAGEKHTVYLGADSGPWPGFAQIAARHPPFDLSMLEIGAYNELWGEIHLGPDGAAKAFAEMGAPGLLMPIHWGLFSLAPEGWRRPMTRMAELADQQGLRLWSPQPGEPTDVHPGTEVRSTWWKPLASAL